MAIGEIPPTDQSNFFTRSVIKFLVVYFIPIPKGTPIAPEINPQKNGMKPQDFERERWLLIEEINHFAELKPEEFKGRHHVFGKLTAR